jgi:hypothetical protein
VNRDSGYNKRTLGGCLAILVGLMLCMAVSVLGLDRLCYESLSRRMPIYPGAEIRVNRYNLFTSRGMGETYLELYSPDPSDVVSEWYGRTTSATLREAARTNDAIYRLARSERNVRRAEDGEGALIELYGTCAQ